MELEQLRQEMKHPKLNLSNPYMNDILNLYATRPTPKKAIQRVVVYYEWLLLHLPDTEKECLTIGRDALIHLL